MNNPYIIEYQRLGTYENQKYIQMEYYPHPTIKKMLKELKNPLSIEDITWIMFQLLKGIEFLHKNFISHRDITTSNILISETNLVIKIIDFGLAKDFGSMEENIFTTTHMMTPLGNYDFRAPELKKGVYNEKVDIWSAGIILKFIWKSTTKLLSSIEDIPTYFESKDHLLSLKKGMLTKNSKIRPSASEALEYALFTVNRNAILNRIQSKCSLDIFSKYSMENEMKKQFESENERNPELPTNNSIGNSEVIHSQKKGSKSTFSVEML